MTSLSVSVPRRVTRSTLSVTDSTLPFLSSSSARVAVVWLLFSRSLAIRVSRWETLPRTAVRSGGMPVASRRRRGRSMARYLRRQRIAQGSGAAREEETGRPESHGEERERRRGERRDRRRHRDSGTGDPKDES